MHCLCVCLCTFCMTDAHHAEELHLSDLLEPGLQMADFDHVVAEDYLGYSRRAADKALKIKQNKNDNQMKERNWVLACILDLTYIFNIFKSCRREI